MKQQCVATYGGTNTSQLRTVPKENIIAATECYNQAEAATLILVYSRWGYSAANTYQKQAALLELARRRASGSISADDFAAIAMQMEAAVMADLHNQDASLKQQRAANAAANAQAWQALSEALNQQQGGYYDAGTPSVAMPSQKANGCIGYAGPGGPCSTGPGGGLYTGPGGGAYTGPGGGAYTGPGGGAYTGPGGGAYTGPGGGAYTGPGGGAYTGPGGGAYAGPGGPCNSGPSSRSTDKWNRPSRYCR